MATNTGNLTPQQLADVPEKEYDIKTGYVADKPIVTLWDGNNPLGRIAGKSLDNLSSFVEGKHFGGTRDVDASMR